MFFAQLGNIVFKGLQTFVTYNTSEEIALAQFVLINRKPKLMAAALGLIKLDLSIFLHVEFTPGSVEDEIGKLRTSKDSFEILPLVWGNGDSYGDWVIQSMEVEYTNLDAQGNVYEARVNLSLLESVEDNKAQQEQQAAAANAFAAGNIRPATKSKRKNALSCPRTLAQLVQEVQQFGEAINQIVSVYTGDQKQAAQVARACGAIIDDSKQIMRMTTNPSSCVFGNTDLQGRAQQVSTQADLLGTDIRENARVVNGGEITGPVPSGTNITAENSYLQTLIKYLAAVAQPVIKDAIIQ